MPELEYSFFVLREGILQLEFALLVLSIGGVVIELLKNQEYGDEIRGITSKIASRTNSRLD